jgi:hypothetical protein
LLRALIAGVADIKSNPLAPRVGQRGAEQNVLTFQDVVDARGSQFCPKITAKKFKDRKLL